MVLSIFHSHQLIFSFSFAWSDVEKCTVLIRKRMILNLGGFLPLPVANSIWVMLFDDEDDDGDRQEMKWDERMRWWENPNWSSHANSLSLSLSSLSIPSSSSSLISTLACLIKLFSLQQFSLEFQLFLWKKRWLTPKTTAEEREIETGWSFEERMIIQQDEWEEMAKRWRSSSSSWCFDESF